MLTTTRCIEYRFSVWSEQNFWFRFYGLMFVYGVVWWCDMWGGSLIGMCLGEYRVECWREEERQTASQLYNAVFGWPSALLPLLPPSLIFCLQNRSGLWRIWGQGHESVQPPAVHFYCALCARREKTTKDSEKVRWLGRKSKWLVCVSQ